MLSTSRPDKYSIFKPKISRKLNILHDLVGLVFVNGEIFIKFHTVLHSLENNENHRNHLSSCSFCSVCVKIVYAFE